ncbi:MAG TPA: hypothetical protein VMM18_17495 [Gemmatimonadaceae bacterium]|nr:hypothetical protein [Gemmatimonadaceae bacterium]
MHASRRTLVVGLRLLLVSMSAMSQAVAAQSACTEPAIDPADVRTWLAEVGGMDAEAHRLWGRALSGPVLFVDRATRRVVANVADAEGRLTACEGVYVGTLPPEQNAANTAVSWAGREWTMLLAPLPRDGYARRRLIGHELFHRVQPALGIPMSDPSNAHLAGRDGRIWLRLEMRALAEALIRQRDERQTAITDALAFRARRQAEFGDAASQEAALELNEGLAEYTGWRVSGLPDHVLADRAAVRLGSAEAGESFARSFAYATGPAYALLLDDAGSPWRRGLRAGDDLAALLARAHGISGQLAGRADARAAAYDGAFVIAQETRRAERLAARSAELRGRFIDGPTLRLPVGEPFRYSFDPNQAEPLDGVGTVYASARITDEWGVLTVEGGGVLLLRDTDGRIAGVALSLRDAPAPPLHGDRWRLSLAEAWETAAGARPRDLVARRR